MLLERDPNEPDSIQRRRRCGPGNAGAVARADAMSPLKRCGSGVVVAAALARGEQPVAAPRASANGSLLHYITHAETKRFQPANITFDLLVPLEEELRKKIRDKKERHRLQCERSLAAFDDWWSAMPHPAAELRC